MDTSFLTKKYGPVSGWVYCLAAAGILYYLYKKYQSVNTKTADTTTVNSANGAIINTNDSNFSSQVSTQGNYDPTSGTSMPANPRPINIGTLMRTVRTVDPSTVNASNYNGSQSTVVQSSNGGKKLVD